MKFKRKRFLVIFITLLLCINTLACSLLAAENESQITESSVDSVQNEEETQIMGNDSVGDMVTEKLLDEQERKSAACSVTDIVVEGRIATVNYNTNVVAEIVVSVFSEDGMKLLLSENGEITPESSVAKVTFAEDLPEYFLIRAFITDINEHFPLCDSYTSTLYTKDIQAIKNSVAGDYEAEQVVNLDENDETNFLVCGKDTVKIEHSAGQNVLIEVQNGTYRFDSADEKSKSLRPGDDVVYIAEDGDITTITVQEAVVDGDSVIITSSKERGELTDYFDVVKYEESLNNAAVTVDESVMDDGFSYIGSEKKTKSYSSRGIDLEVDNSFGQTFSFSLNKELANPITSSEKTVKISGSVSLGITGNISALISLSHSYVKYETKIKVSANVSLTGSLIMDFPFAGFIFDLKLIKIGFIPEFTVTATGKLNASASFTCSFGATHDSKSGDQPVSSPPKGEASVKAEGTIFIGFKTSFYISLIKKWGIDLDASAGVEVSAKMNIAEIETSAEKKHICDACLKGEVQVKAVAKTKVDLGSIFSLSLDVINLQVKIPEADFYYSITYSEFGLGKCPHNKYRVDIKAVNEENKAVSGAQVKLTSSETNEALSGTTDDAGQLCVYALPDTYKIESVKDKLTGSGSITVKDAKISKTITLKPKKYLVTFKVKDNKGNPVSGAVGSSDNFSILSSTNSSGTTTANVSEGSYKVKFTKSNSDGTSMEGSADFTISDQPITVNVTLEGEEETESETGGGFSGSGYGGAQGGVHNSGNVTITVGNKGTYRYTGSPIEPSLTVISTYNGNQYTMVEGTHYSVSYEDNHTNIGIGYVTVTGLGEIEYPDGTKEKLEGSAYLTFDIVGEIYVYLDQEEFDYTGSEIRPTVHVVRDGRILTENIDYRLTYTDNRDPGYGMVYITTLTGTSETAELAFIINDVSGAAITSAEESVSELEFSSAYVGEEEITEIEVQAESETAESIGTEMMEDETIGAAELMDIAEENLEIDLSGEILPEETLPADPEPEVFSQDEVVDETIIDMEDGSCQEESADEALYNTDENFDLADPVDKSLIDASQEAELLSAGQEPAFKLMKSYNGSASANGQTRTATFHGLAAEKEHILAAVIDPSAENFFASENLLYIAQETADAQGNLVLDYIPRMETEHVLRAYGEVPDADLADAEMTVGSLVYNGKDQEVSVSVVYNGTVLQKDTDYTLTGAVSVKNVGVYEITAIGKNNYTGQRTCSFSVEKAAQTVQVSVPLLNAGETGFLSVTGIGSFTYSSDNENIVSVDTDGKVRAIAAGTARITVTAGGDQNYQPGIAVVSVTVKKGSADNIDETSNTEKPEQNITEKEPEKESESQDNANNQTNKPESESGEKNPAHVHQFGAWIITAEATVFAPENQKRSCVTCGESETRTIGVKLAPTIKLNASSFPLQVKKSTKALKISGLANGDYVVSWKSANKKIATVNGTGKITAKKVGKTKITVTLASGMKKIVTVKVQKAKVKTASISGIKKKITLKKGKSLQLLPVLKPITSQDKVTYKSSKKSVVTVSSKGKIKAKKKGKAVITVKAGKKKVKCTVTVK